MNFFVNLFYNQDVRYLVCHKVSRKIWGRLNNNGIGVFYVKWSNNFGDLLTPILLSYYGFTPYFEYPARAKAACVGTIISLLNKDFNGWIVGSGWNNDAQTEYPQAKFLGVRGNLTKEKLRLNDNVVIGDPGLLISEIYRFNEPKRYRVGLIPHESETNDYRLLKLISNLGDDCILIKPNNPSVKEILKLINQCDYILSSSLHGLIVSDSYNIPNGRIKLNDVHDSNDFKFRDYYSSLGEKLSTLQILGNETEFDLIKHTRLPQKERIDSIKSNLDLMFKKFRNTFYGEK
jgi:hypothetical protein